MQIVLRYTLEAVDLTATYTRSYLRDNAPAKGDFVRDGGHEFVVKSRVWDHELKTLTLDLELSQPRDEADLRVREGLLRNAGWERVDRRKQDRRGSPS